MQGSDRGIQQCYRSQIDAKSQHLEHAGRLLLEAAGIKAEQVKPPNVLFSNLTDHPGILRELAKALEVFLLGVILDELNDFIAANSTMSAAFYDSGVSVHNKSSFEVHCFT